MELASYLKYLRQEKNLRESVCRTAGRILSRFHSFLHNESVADLASVDTSLLQRYAKTLQDLAPSTSRYHLTVISLYLARTEAWRDVNLNSPESTSRTDSKVISPARRSGSISRQGNSAQLNLKEVLSSLPRSDEQTTYIPTFEEIRNVIEVASNQDRTLPLAQLTCVLASSAIRIGELARLRVTDVVSDMGLVRVESTGVQGQRYIPLSPRAIHSLKSLHCGFADSVMIFGDRSNSYLSGLCGRFHILGAKSGNAQLQVHSLRRAALGYLHSLARTGLEDYAVRYVAGWWSPMSSDKSEPDIDTVLPVVTRLLANLWEKVDCDIN